MIALMILFVAFLQNDLKADEKHIVIVTASYKNKDWYRRNLDSIFMQNYSNYHVIYIDDCSPDGTFELVKTYVDDSGYKDHFILISNETRQGAMTNQYNAINSCNPTDIIIILDGDDWFANANVLSYINNVYQDPNIWLTYGQFQEYPSGRIGFCQMFPSSVVSNNSFRHYPHIPSHLRTYYAGLFQKIKKEDLMFNGQFVPMAPDLAAMIPMIEMARDHFKFIPDVLLMYNAANSLNEYKIDKQLQRSIDVYMRHKPRYTPLDKLFDQDIA